jgi:hypothetical protein
MRRLFVVVAGHFGVRRGGTVKKLKKDLSGAAKRKLAKQRLMASAPALEGNLLRRIRVGELNTVDQWRREIGKIYREMRFQKIPTEVGTRLVYVAEIGARLAKMAEELRELEALRQQLAQLQGVPTGLITHNRDTINGALEVTDHESEE